MYWSSSKSFTASDQQSLDPCLQLVLYSFVITYMNICSSQEGGKKSILLILESQDQSKYVKVFILCYPRKNVSADSISLNAMQ